MRGRTENIFVNAGLKCPEAGLTESAIRETISHESCRQPSKAWQGRWSTRAPRREEPARENDVIRVLIVCHVRLYREGLERILGQSPSLEVVGTAKDGDTAIRQARQLGPDIVLLDVAVPDALSTLRDLASNSPDCKVIALGLLEPSDDVLACAEAGVSGYVFRDDPLDDLLATLESTHCGRLRCSTRVAAMLLQHVSTLAAAHVPPRHNLRLTRRELQVVGLLREGLSNKQIAARLSIEVATVKNHVHSILEKLNVQSRAEAATRLRELGPSRYAQPP